MQANMTTVTGRLTDYGNVHDFRSVLEDRLNAKRSELGETEQSLKKFIGSRLGNTMQKDATERLPAFRGRLGPVVPAIGGRGGGPSTGERRTSIGSRLGPKVMENLEDDSSSAKAGANGFGGEVTGRGSVMSRIVVEQKSREDALAEQKTDKKETQRNKRMFGSILGTLQKFRADESKDKDRELKKRKIEAKIDQKTEQEREEAIRQKKELFEDKRIKEREIKVLQVQMKRVEEFETWERSKRKEQKYIRTKKGPTKIFFLPRNHNDATLTALEHTMDEIDKEIQAAREIFEDELLKISTRAEQNPNASLDDLEGDDNSADEDTTDKTATRSIVSAIKRPRTDTNRSSEGKDEERNESFAYKKKRNGDIINGVNENSKTNGDEAGVKRENSVTSRNDQVFDNTVDKPEKTDSQLTEESQIASQVIESNEMGKIEYVNEIEVQHDSISGDSKPNLKDDPRYNAQKSASPIKDSGKNDEESKYILESIDKSSAEKRSRSKSPKDLKGQRHCSSSSGERRKNSNKVRIEPDERSSPRKRKSSNIKSEQTSKKSKTSKKKKRSSDESSSSSSSSSDDQTKSDEKSSASNSSSEDSDSSDDSSSSNSKDRKKTKRKVSKTPKTKRTSDNRNKKKESSNVQKRRSRKSRTQSSRRVSNKKESDSSDSD